MELDDSIRELKKLKGEISKFHNDHLSTKDSKHLKKMLILIDKLDIPVRINNAEA
jgi:hypothetical protein